MAWSKKRRSRPWVQVPISVAGTLHVRVAAPGLVELSLRNGQPGATGTVVLGTLPVGYRPSRAQTFAASGGYLWIETTGEVSLRSITNTTAWQYASHLYSTDEEVA